MQLELDAIIHFGRSAMRITELDGLRGLAVIAVLMWHFIGSMSAGEFLVLLTIWGRTGVDLFFVLSGFLVIGILVDEKDTPNVILVFYWRRFLRIYPPYFALIAAYWLIYAWVGETPGFNTDRGIATQILAQVTFTWNWLMAVTNSAVARGFSVTWSVAIEEWFYLVAPWVLIFTPKRHMVRVLVTVGLFSIVARAFAYLSLGSQYALAPYILPPFRLDGLCAGGLLAIGVRNERSLQFFRSCARQVQWLALGFAIATPMVIALCRPALDHHMYLWGHTYLTIGYTAVLLWALLHVGRPQSSFLRVWLLREAGRYSYTLYLFHPLFISLLFTLGGREREIVTDKFSLFLAATAFAGSVGFSFAFYWLVERHLIALGHRARYTRPALA